MAASVWYWIWMKPYCTAVSRCVENTVTKPLTAGADQHAFQTMPSADFIVPVEIESQTHNVYVIKRPGVDMFLKAMGEIYEVVVFTASLSKVRGLGIFAMDPMADCPRFAQQYADPVLDMLDIHKVVKHRLFRESCYNHKGNYVKVSAKPDAFPTVTLTLDFPCRTCPNWGVRSTPASS